MTEGILLIDKPSGMTSHDVVVKVRKKFQIRKVGHAGTLDPLATGLLIVLLGSSTKLFNEFVGLGKTYEATFILGLQTDSFDTEGQILREQSSKHITEGQVQEQFQDIIGESLQMPPMFSAVKKGGRKLYELARRGVSVEREPRPIKIEELSMMTWNPPHVQFYLQCSSGTYVRQIVEDIGVKLGCGACITEIKRLTVGEFHICNAVKLNEVNESHIRNWENKIGV